MLKRGLWCECWTEDLAEQQRPALLASFDAYSAPQADRRVSVALRSLRRAGSPVPLGAPLLPSAPAPPGCADAW